jgi:hypothetical protein
VNVKFDSLTALTALTAVTAVTAAFQNIMQFDENIARCPFLHCFCRM